MLIMNIKQKYQLLLLADRIIIFKNVTIVRRTKILHHVLKLKSVLSNRFPRPEAAVSSEDMLSLYNGPLSHKHYIS